MPIAHAPRFRQCFPPQVLIAGIALVASVAATTALADDLNPPPFRGQPGSTFQAWDYNTPALGAPDAACPANNPFGVANAAAQYYWTKALLMAPTAAVSPFYYLMLVWAMAIGFIVWGDVPTIELLIGSAIVVAAGLFLLWHEAKRPR